MRADAIPISNALVNPKKQINPLEAHKASPSNGIACVSKFKTPASLTAVGKMQSGGGEYGVGDDGGDACEPARVPASPLAKQPVARGYLGNQNAPGIMLLARGLPSEQYAGARIDYKHIRSLPHLLWWRGHELAAISRRGETSRHV